jgi:hypothetical protein
MTNDIAALDLVDSGAVVIRDGCRDYPGDGRVLGNTLTSTHRRGLWCWPNDPPKEGDVALLTEAGRRVVGTAVR